jgi:flagellar basal-body rod protein FlgC
VGGGVKVSKIVNDPRPLIRVYMPAHPHADKEGMVTMPNVNMLEEMADMMIATRSYEANLQAIRAGKQMLNGAMEIGAAQ